MNIIIASHLKESIINQLLKENKAIFNLNITTLDSFINNIINYDINLYELYLKLNNLELNKLNNSIKEIDFLKELVSNRKLIDIYKIKIDDLDIIEDYKKCLKEVPSFDYSLIDEYINNHDFNDYIIYDNNYDLYHRDIINKLLNKGAKLKSFTNNNLTINKNITTNIKEAVTSIASYIIQNNLDLNDIAIITSQEYYQYLKIMLNLYNINTRISNYNISNKANEFIALCDFYIHQDIKSYLNIISSSYKGQDDYLVMNEYLYNHSDNFMLEEFNRFKDEKSYYHDLEYKANLIHQKYINELKVLVKFNFKEAITYIFDLIKDNSKTTLKIKKIIEDYKDYLEESYFIYHSLILDIKESDTDNGLLITNYQKDIYDKDYLFILDPNLKNYPGFTPLSGFLNEDVLAKTNYPSLELRYDNHLKSFNYIKMAKHIIYFMINSTLDGKSVEYDDSISKLTNLDINIINNEYHNYINYHHELDSESAKAIFIKNNEIRGSISSFEKYFNCPYSYFLNYGLGLYDDNKFELSSALTGTLIHEVMENLVNDKAKTYYLDYESILDNTLNKYYQRLIYIFPKQIEYIKASFIRIRESIILEMKFINSMEEDTDFIPSKTEYRFDYDIVSDDETKLHLKGIIDRIDTYVNEFRIIDYKTSIHNLNKDKIARGLQLQLLTYAIIYETISKDIASSALYLNIKHSPNRIDEYSFSKKSGITKNIINDDILYDTFIKDHKLKGLIFNDSEALDHNYKHINTLKKNAISKQYLIDFDKTKELILNIYKYLLNSIKEGNIDLKPCENACTWCNYHRICHYRGIKKDRDIISDINIGVEDETE